MLKPTLRLPQGSDAAEGTPRGCSTAVGIVQQHYNPDREVVLRSEFLPEHQFRVIASACSPTQPETLPSAFRLAPWGNPACNSLLSSPTCTMSSRLTADAAGLHDAKLANVQVCSLAGAEPCALAPSCSDV